MDEIAALVDEGVELDSAIKAKSKRLDEIKATLRARGVGEYKGTGSNVAKVLEVEASIKPVAEQKADAARKLAADHFPNLFARTVTFLPVKGFRAVCVALLTPAKAAKLIALCEKENTPQVRFSA